MATNSVRRAIVEIALRQLSSVVLNNIYIYIYIWNVGTMTGEAREIADVLRRRKVDIACVQEVKWKGSKARNVGHGYKLFYHGDTINRNGVGIILREERTKDILEISRISDRIILLKLAYPNTKEVTTIISAYAPQQGLSKNTWHQQMKEDMTGVGVTQDVALDRKEWRRRKRPTPTR